MNRTFTGILCASLVKHMRAASSVIPPISNNTVPGLTTAAQYSGSPLPLPMRVSKGIEVIGLCGNMRMYNRPSVRKYCRAAIRPASIVAAYPAALSGLQSVVAENYSVSTGSITFYTPSLAFSVLDPFWHQRHRYLPRYMFPG